MSTGAFGTSISEAGQAMATQLQLQVQMQTLQAEMQELEMTIPGLRATTYLSGECGLSCLSLLELRSASLTLCAVHVHVCAMM
jgi:hypothetical protein